MITARLYDAADRQAWDSFVDGSKNGTFMLKRGYVEYHADRFVDASVVFEDDAGSVVAVMPASRHGDEVRSHGGLTYGGVITDRRMTAVRMLEAFDALRAHLKSEGVARLVYKRVPAIYYGYPSDEDLYALFRCGARLSRRDIASTIDLADPIPFANVRTRYVKKAAKNGLCVRQTDDYDGYVRLLTDVLMTHHNARPPHTGGELRLLASRFPDEVRLYCAYRGDEMLAGVLAFLTPRVLHTQYIANSEAGRPIGALDLVMDHLVREVAAGRRYFDFGICTEQDGRYLNEGLIGQKEMFGGRGVAYDFYEMEV